MQRGDFASAWRISDEVLRRRVAGNVDCSHLPRHLQFVWRGAPLDGRHVLVRCHHGLGDTLQFCRLLSILRPRVASIDFCVQPALLDLMQCLPAVSRCRSIDEPPLQAEVAIELMELPHALRLGLDDIPRQVPYLHVPAQRRPHADARMHVGLAWEAGQWNPGRSLPARALHPWASIPGVCWYSLQYPPTPPPFPMRELACKSIVTLAARMQALDLLISVDTMQAHLAGALGVPVWLLLQRQPDWRWMLERDDSPWYPTMRLLRQRRRGDWSEVVEEVRIGLRQASAIRERDIRSSGCTASSG